MKIGIKSRFTELMLKTVEVPDNLKSLSGANLSKADLSGANLSGADLSKADLSKADLSKADLSGASLYWANLSGADLSKADLSGANLSKADLSGANLSGANLSGANLSGADLSEADLSGASLYWANLSKADLSGANLSKADLSGANLSEADLSEADLSGANLSGANLSKADLSGANLSEAKNVDLAIARTRILAEGDVIGWKQCAAKIIVKLLIPAAAKRSSAFGRKCRAEYAVDLGHYLADGTEARPDHEAYTSQHGPRTIYRKGETIRPDSWDEDWQKECSHGIHFYITRLEAENN